MKHCLLALVLAASMLPPAPAAADEPTAFEIEMWRAASRLDTVESYKEYLARFPSGGFAAMARQAMQRLTPGAAAQATAAPEGLDAAALAELKAAASETGATNIRIGERFVGPGVLTVGWLGAKKQIVVPSGEWVALAAYDHTIAGFATMQLTTVALGQFVRDRLQTLWVTTSSSKPFYAPPGIPRPSAPQADACRVSDPAKAFHDIQAISGIQTCAQVLATTEPQWPGQLPPGAHARVARALERLKVATFAPSLMGELHLTDRASLYVGYQLLATDGLPPVQSPGGAAERGPAAAQALAGWLKEMRSYAALGHAQRLDVSDLAAGARGPGQLPALR